VLEVTAQKWVVVSRVVIEDSVIQIDSTVLRCYSIQDSTSD